MRRAIVISEDFGLYRIKRGDEVLGSGTTLEKALAKATPTAPLDFVFNAAQVLEPLLGEKRPDSELVTT